MRRTLIFTPNVVDTDLGGIRGRAEGRDGSKESPGVRKAAVASSAWGLIV